LLFCICPCFLFCVCLFVCFVFLWVVARNSPLIEESQSTRQDTVALAHPLLGYPIDALSAFAKHVCGFLLFFLCVAVLYLSMCFFCVCLLFFSFVVCRSLVFFGLLPKTCAATPGAPHIVEQPFAEHRTDVPGSGAAAVLRISREVER